MSLPSPPKRRSSPLGALVPEALAPALRERGFANASILTEWAEIVGPELAPLCHPLSLRWPRRKEEAATAKAGDRRRTTARAEGAVLVVGCAGAYALDVQMAAGRMIEAVNRRLGWGLVRSIEIRQGTAPKRARPVPAPGLDPAEVTKAETSLGDIADPELRRALATLDVSLRRTRRRPLP